MIKTISNEKGIALITALLLSSIMMTIIMYLMYMLTGSITTSGAHRRYKTVLEASYGSSELIIKEIFPLLLSDVKSSATNLKLSPLTSAFDITSTSDSCFQQKLTQPSSKWSADCSKSADATSNPDITLQFKSTSLDKITVYTKIVESMCSDPRPYPEGTCTSSDLSGVDYLDGGTGVNYGSGGVSAITVQQIPATYRVEIEGQRATNPIEKTKLSVLYSY